MLFETLHLTYFGRHNNLLINFKFYFQTAKNKINVFILYTKQTAGQEATEYVEELKISACLGKETRTNNRYRKSRKEIKDTGVPGLQHLSLLREARLFPNYELGSLLSILAETSNKRSISHKCNRKNLP